MTMFDDHIDLRLPGPTIVPAPVRYAIAQGAEHPAMNYRSQRFAELHRSVSHKLRQVMRTDSDVVILSGSGTAALEAGIGSVVGTGDTVITAVAGYFAEYASAVCDAIGANNVRIEAEWGRPIDADAVAAALQRHPEARAVVVTHCETSTGVVSDVRAIAEVVAASDAVFAIDAVSSLVSTPIEMDAWGIDLLMSASQKALMLPPGLAFLAASEKAWSRIEARSARSYYFDVAAYRNAARSGATPYTPNVPLVLGLDVALDLILDEGLEAAWERHALLRDMMRSGVRALGLRPFADDDCASSTLTTVAIDDADALRSLMHEELRVVVGGGLGRTRDRLLRLGHLGFAAPLDVVTLLAALETALVFTGRSEHGGAGVAAAQRVWAEARAQRAGR